MISTPLFLLSHALAGAPGECKALCPGLESTDKPAYLTASMKDPVVALTQHIGLKRQEQIKGCLIGGGIGEKTRVNGTVDILGKEDL